MVVFGTAVATSIPRACITFTAADFDTHSIPGITYISRPTDARPLPPSAPRALPRLLPHTEGGRFRRPSSTREGSRAVPGRSQGPCRADTFFMLCRRRRRASEAGLGRHGHQIGHGEVGVSGVAAREGTRRFRFFMCRVMRICREKCFFSGTGAGSDASCSRVRGRASRKPTSW